MRVYIWATVFLSLLSFISFYCGYQAHLTGNYAYSAFPAALILIVTYLSLPRELEEGEVDDAK